jgi:protocatechuate 3,4-dioxygenase beta subunit
LTQVDSLWSASMDHDHDHDHDDYGGLRRDLPQVIGRRRALQLLGGAGLVGLAAACGGSGGSGGATSSASPSSTTTGATTTTAAGAAPDTATTDAAAGTPIPSETEGPFPADGSNGPNVLTEAGIVRGDLRPSFAGLSGTAEGVLTTMQLTIVDAATGQPRAGAAVYAWHCTADGQYSLYEIADQNYLRGVQAADDAGRLTFTTIFPGCYGGRWPHVHFEVFESLDDATGGSAPARISQLALPEADCATVYAEAEYGNSASNLGRLSLESDMIFADGWSDQLATVSGSVADGYTVSLLVRV